MERVLANKANWLVAHGHEVSVVTTDQRGEKPFFPLDEHIRCFDLGIDYEENNGKGFLNKLLHYPFKQWKHHRRLEALLKEQKADVVVSMFCNDASFLPKIKDGSKKVLEIHFSRYKLLQYGRKGLWSLADKWRSANYERIASRYDKFVVLTEEDSQYWNHLDNLVVIPNARTFVCDTPASLVGNEVIAVGRYTYQKGYDRLITAWRRVHEVLPDWKLRIVGDGELRQEMEEMIKAQGLEDCVILGRSTHGIQELYLNASIAAMSSHYEGLPMVLLEAQSAGLPIVSFDCKCGPKDIVRDGENGFLVHDNDVEGLAESIIRVAEDTDLRKRMGKEAYKDSEKYDEDRIMARWETMFTELTK